MQVDQLEAWSIEVLQACGVGADDAREVAQSLAYAELRGVQSHGFIRLPTYVERLQAGGINPRPEPRWITEGGAFSIMTADFGPGASTARMGVDGAISRAKEFGIGCVIARDANHFGAAGYFSERIAAAGALGIVACNTDAVMCAPFGGRPVLGTNPISIAVPSEDGPRPLLDMATTEASFGKLVVAAQKGDSIPLGWAVDANGTPTTDPSAGIAGALLPSGGPKGFGLAFMVDAMLALGGARVSPFVDALYGDPSRPQSLGHLFIAIDSGVAESPSAYHDAISQLVDAVHASGPGAGGRPALIPGEPEAMRAAANGETIILTPEQQDELIELGIRVERPFPAAVESEVNA